MHVPNDITFGRFRLDTTNECLWQKDRAIPLRPKAFAVLKLLVARPGQLVTKQQVLDTVWPGTFVSDAVLKDCIRQLREALQDDAAAPTYIETAHRRGYRFIAKPSEAAATKRLDDAARGTPPPIPAPVSGKCSTRMLGRQAELVRMRGWLDRALAGERQIAFVTGEAGIGKTTLVQALLEQAAESGAVKMGRGQCL